ncbi:MAG: gliding motility-associated C-terminal domain-containing protein [Bacteroidota bacterium]|nr:gliding motility-associated C-terminal domain-containing protein [Bacteroidota bacterium]
MKTFKQIKTMLLLVIATVTGINTAIAADPNWTVNPPDFQYNMTMLAVINIDCAEQLSPSNRIGIFMGNECRGTALTSTVINGKFMASLFVYSNTVNGESLSFKVYDAANDIIYDAHLTVKFQQNASYGTAISPYVVYSKFPCLVNKQALPANNLITPDGDGINDFFAIEDVDSYKDFALTIYNDFGLEVYKISRDYKNNWGATYQDKTLPDGAYYFLFKNETNGKEYKGIINVVNPD